MERLSEVANPVIKQVYENQGGMYENIMIPITDGKRMYNISCNLKEAYETECKAIVKSFQKSIVLHTIDEAWKEHLREMDELRHSVQNASYENKDPLLIYKLESYNLFKTMVDNMNRKTASILMRGQIPVREEPRQTQAEAEAAHAAAQRVAVQQAAAGFLGVILLAHGIDVVEDQLRLTEQLRVRLLQHVVADQLAQRQ